MIISFYVFFLCCIVKDKSVYVLVKEMTFKRKLFRVRLLPRRKFIFHGRALLNFLEGEFTIWLFQNFHVTSPSILLFNTFKKMQRKTKKEKNNKAIVWRYFPKGFSFFLLYFSPITIKKLLKMILFLPSFFCSIFPHSQHFSFKPDFYHDSNFSFFHNRKIKRGFSGF